MRVVDNGNLVFIGGLHMCIVHRHSQLVINECVQDFVGNRCLRPSYKDIAGATLHATCILAKALKQWPVCNRPPSSPECSWFPATGQ